MCGICGYISYGKPIEEKRDVLREMCGLIRHRGPDEEGLHLEGSVGLGHRRLSIIDLGTGKQPMGSADGSLWLVFNGEIYNFQEIRDELSAKGFAFRTKSDTEVILQGYAAWGTGILSRLNGMFVFALWDSRRKRLFAARDRLGKKPLYYHAGRDRFLFASEMKSILAEKEVSREVDPASVDKYFTYGYVPAPDCIFKGIRKLLPGHYLTWEDGRVKEEKYWDVRYGGSSDCRTEDDYAEKLHSLLTQSVKRRLISDVPLGAFLSGGLDSSVIVGIMASLSRDPVKTFTIGFEEQGYSEVEDARALSRAFKTDHHEFTVRPDAVDLLPHLVWHFDEPFADSSAVPTFYVSQMARKGVTVALSGDGGDELFAGYNHYSHRMKFKSLRMIPRSLREKALGAIARRLPMGTKGKFALLDISRSEARENYEIMEIWPPIKDQLYSPEFLGRLRGCEDPMESIRRWTDFPANSTLSKMQYLDTKVYLPEDILMKVDRMSMANSLETRAPLLDYTVVEFAATIPPDLQRKDGLGKYILRKMAARYLPPEALAKKKQGFAVPRDRWFRNELKGYAQEMLGSKRFQDRGYFRRGTVETMLKEHFKGERDYSLWIWSLINFELWHQAFLDGGTRRI